MYNKFIFLIHLFTYQYIFFKKSLFTNINYSQLIHLDY